MSQLPSRSRSRRLWMVAWLVLLSGWFGGAASQQFSFRQYAQSDGLTNLAAGYLMADPSGDLWVGTDGGLFRFDGTAFVSYDTALGVPSETVRGLALDRISGRAGERRQCVRHSVRLRIRTGRGQTELIGSYRRVKRERLRNVGCVRRRVVSENRDAGGAGRRPGASTRRPAPGRRPWSPAGPTPSPANRPR